jgi:hypothetical protein
VEATTPIIHAAAVAVRTADHEPPLTSRVHMAVDPP